MRRETRPGWRRRTQPCALGNEHGDRGAEVRARVVVKGRDQLVCAQHLVHACALHADAAAVHEPHLPKSGLVRGFEIGNDHVGYVTRSERVEVDLRFDWNDVRIHLRRADSRAEHGCAGDAQAAAAAGVSRRAASQSR